MAKKGASRAASGTIQPKRKVVVRNGKQYTYWNARITIGYDTHDGHQIQKSFTGATQREVIEKAQAYQMHQCGSPISENLTLGEWLDRWSTDYLNSVKPYTRVSYMQHIKNHIAPALGHIRLTELKGPDIQRFYNELLRSGAKVPAHNKDGSVKKRNGSPVYVSASLSAKTVRNIHGVLHKALEQAVKVELLRTNPSDTCDLPRSERPEIQPLDKADIAKLMEAVRGHRYEMLYLTMLFTGLRRGEACGLLWDCVDLDRGTIIINKQLQSVPGQPGSYRLVTTKNGKSRTLVVAPFVVGLLKELQEKQEQMRADIGEMWDKTGYVFCNDFGGHLSTSTVYHNYKKIVASIGLPDSRLHDLRHSFAVASLQAGDDIKTVQGNLGHHSPAFTMATYLHVTESMKQASANRMEQYIAELPVPKRENKGKTET